MEEVISIWHDEALVHNEFCDDLRRRL